MARLTKKNLCETTLTNLAPPYLNYEYFKDCTQLPFRYESNIFDIVNAWWLIEAATLVYADKEFATEKFKQNAGFQEVAYFDGEATQCYVASNEKFAVVAFRGSEARLREGNSNVGHIFADWMANLNFAPEPWEQGGNVHRGFKGALDEVWDDLEDYISNLQKSHRKIWMSGHSLGAALATLAADRYGKVQGLYTYGSPRVGDRNFKEDFNVNAYRFVNNSDIVTKVPPAAMYLHVGELKYIDSEAPFMTIPTVGKNGRTKFRANSKIYLMPSARPEKDSPKCCWNPSQIMSRRIMRYISGIILCRWVNNFPTRNSR